MPCSTTTVVVVEVAAHQTRTIETPRLGPLSSTPSHASSPLIKQTERNTKALRVQVRARMILLLIVGTYIHTWHEVRHPRLHTSSIVKPNINIDLSTSNTYIYI